jgi:hypothetical protein
VKRNWARFPEDFRFRLAAAEVDEIARSGSRAATLNPSQFVTGSAERKAMRSQFATASKRNVRFRPYAFTEHGAIMAANVLNAPQAVRMSVFVVRAFVQMRELLSGSRELAQQLAVLEQKLTARLDVHETAIVEILRRIMELVDPPPPPPEPPRRKIGFHPESVASAQPDLRDDRLGRVPRISAISSPTRRQTAPLMAAAVSGRKGAVEP